MGSEKRLLGVLCPSAKVHQAHDRLAVLDVGDRSMLTRLELLIYVDAYNETVPKMIIL